MRVPFVGGNHKMNGTLQSLTVLLQGVLAGAGASLESLDAVVAPPAPYLALAQQTLHQRRLAVAAQNCHEQLSGAFTGETSVAMLRDLGVSWVILGHSERRHVFGETDAQLAAKVRTVQTGNLSAIVCVGEKLSEREAHQTTEVCFRQLEAFAGAISDWSRIVVAYEPVWAIGTGRTASPEQAAEVHTALRQWLRERVSESVARSTRIIYGGSVTDKNVAALAAQDDIDGMLVGGASLQVDSFVSIINATAAEKKKRSAL